MIAVAVAAAAAAEIAVVVGTAVVGFVSVARCPQFGLDSGNSQPPPSRIV